MAITSIWRGVTVTFGQSSSADYQIADNDGNIIFSGRAVKRPDQTYLRVDIAPVIQDFLKPELPAFDTMEAYPSKAVGVFRVLNGQGEFLNSYQILNDWSYDAYFNANTNTELSRPIDGRVSPLQYIVYSSVGQVQYVPCTLHFANGTSSVVNITTQGVDGIAYDAILPLCDYNDVVAVDIGNIHYIVDRSCARFALVYLNPYGGWDTLLMRGMRSESENYERTTYNSDDGKKVINNKVKESSVLHTGWMDDDASSKMRYLLSSTDVFLYDLAEQDIIPVVITDSSHTVQTYRGNGGKLVSYAVNIESSKEKYRR